MIQIVCDGCTEPTTVATLTARTSTYLGVPPGDIHLCRRCAILAIHAAVVEGPTTPPEQAEPLVTEIGSVRAQRSARTYLRIPGED